MSKNFKQRLKDAKKNWKGARSRAEDMGGGDFPDIEDGRYRGALTQCGPIVESNSSDRIHFPIGFTILEGDFKDQKAVSYHGVENEDSLMYLARDIAKLGYEVPDGLEGLDELGEEILGNKLVCIFRLKHKGDFQNLYIDKVESDEAPESEEEEKEEAEETEEGPVSLFETGQEVSFDWDGEQAQAKIINISADGETLTVKDDDGEYEVEADDCSLVETEEEETVPEEPGSDEPDFAPGDRVKSQFDDEWFGGEVISVDGDTLGHIKIKFDDGSEEEVAVDEVFQEEEEEPEFEVGQKVSFMHKGKEMYGTIRSFVSGGDHANIKGGDNKLYRNVSLEDLAIPADNEPPI